MHLSQLGNVQTLALVGKPGYVLKKKLGHHKKIYTYCRKKKTEKWYKVNYYFQNKKGILCS
jgi:hypothetical protein